MATELMGFEIGATSAWLVWILPFAAALIIPGIAKLSKNVTGNFSKHATGYVAVGFALMSTLSAASLIPIALEAGEIHHQIPLIQLPYSKLPKPHSCTELLIYRRCLDKFLVQ